VASILIVIGSFFVKISISLLKLNEETDEIKKIKKQITSLKKENEELIAQIEVNNLMCIDI